MKREPRYLSELPLVFQLFERLDPENLGDPPGHLGTITDRIGYTAKITKRGRGGWWAITCQWNGPDWEKEEFFIDGLQREIRVMVGSDEVFRGFVGKMQLTRPSGEIYLRDWTQIYNKWKSIYTRIGDNELNNGGAETSAWASYGSPTTNAQSAAWFTEGQYSNYTVANSAGDGATIQSTSLSIVAAKAYQAQVSVNIVSGKWVFEVYRTDNGESLAQRIEDNTGESILSVSISDENTYAGNIGLRLYLHDDSSSGSIYGDGAIFQDAPYRSETSWYEDTASQAEFGVKEDIVLLPGSSDEAARNRAQTELRKAAWAHSFPPDNYSQITTPATRLDLTIMGYVVTLNNLHSEQTGTDDIDDFITKLIGDAEFVSAGVIEENTTDYFIDTRGPLRVWDLIDDMTLTGDNSGNRYECGVSGSREFYYTLISDEPIYKQRGGVIYGLDGAEVAPWEMTPGYVLLEDMPLGPEEISGYETDNPRVVYAFETTFDIENWLAGGSGIQWRRERDG